ncbi:MAG: polysaccharide biosynthesis C-terminal domain-containing protein, partial [Clostridia bacterium]|nr:polysaccharide biosynthesis C-terminal domain-containing protein [Clostridia bacterium]
GSTETILPYAIDYLRYILIGAPYMTASLVLNNQLRFQSNAMYGMIGITSGAVLNIALDPLFIFVFNMGISGAALATIISQFAGFVLLFFGVEKSGAIQIRPRNFKPSKSFYGMIVNGGIPSLMRQGINSVATICLNFAAGGYGDAVIAGMSIVNRIMQFAYACLIGFGQGFQPVCGFNYGAKKYARVREAFYFCVKVSFFFLLVVGALGFIFAPNVVALFRKGDPMVIEVGTIALRFQCAVFPLACWVVMSNMMAQTIGKAFRATFLALSRTGLFFAPAILILPHFFGVGGIESAQMVADIIAFAVSIPIQLSILKEMQREEKLLSIQS